MARRQLACVSETFVRLAQPVSRQVIFSSSIALPAELAQVVSCEFQEEKSEPSLHRHSGVRAYLCAAVFLFISIGISLLVIVVASRTLAAQLNQVRHPLGRRTESCNCLVFLSKMPSKHTQLQLATSPLVPGAQNISSSGHSNSSSSSNKARSTHI